MQLEVIGSLNEGIENGMASGSNLELIVWQSR